MDKIIQKHKTGLRYKGLEYEILYKKSAGLNWFCAQSTDRKYQSDWMRSQFDAEKQFKNRVTIAEAKGEYIRPKNPLPYSINPKTEHRDIDLNEVTAHHKYDVKYADELFRHLSQGYSLPSFCADKPFTHVTLYNWIKTIPEMKDAHDRGKAAALKFWETLNIASATDTLPESLKARGAKRINDRAVQFTLKTRFRDIYFEKGEDQPTTVIQNTIGPEQISRVQMDEETRELAKALAERLAEE